MKIIKLECKKDWILDGITHFKKRTTYEGEWAENQIRQGINTFYIKGGCFHSGSEYFDIPFGD